MVPSDQACYTDAKVESTCLRARGAQISRWLSFSGHRGRTHLITTAYRLPPIAYRLSPTAYRLPREERRT